MMVSEVYLIPYWATVVAAIMMILTGALTAQSYAGFKYCIWGGMSFKIYDPTRRVNIFKPTQTPLWGLWLPYWLGVSKKVSGCLLVLGMALALLSTIIYSLGMIAIGNS